MKSLLLPLLVASPILAALAPHADAGAIALDSRVLRPRLLSPASFRQANRAGVPGSVFRGSVATAASTAINNSLLSGGTLNIGGGVIKTGAGTISLGSGSLLTRWESTEPATALRWADGLNSATLTGGTVNANGGVVTQSTWLDLGSVSGATLVVRQHEPDFIRGFTSIGGSGAISVPVGPGTIDTNGFNVRIAGGNGLTLLDTATLANGLNGSVLTRTGSGTLTLGDRTGFRVVSDGILDFGSSQTLDALTITDGAIVNLSTLPIPPVPAGVNGGSITIAPAPAQVPEPGTAILFTFGLLAASQVRRPRTV